MVLPPIWDLYCTRADFKTLTTFSFFVGDYIVDLIFYIVTLAFALSCVLLNFLKREFTQNRCFHFYNTKSVVSGQIVVQNCLRVLDIQQFSVCISSFLDRFGITNARTSIRSSFGLVWIMTTIFHLMFCRIVSSLSISSRSLRFQMLYHMS